MEQRIKNKEEITINIEKIVSKIQAIKKTIKKYIYIFLYVVFNNIFRTYSGYSTYYGGRWGITTSGYDFWTEIILCGFKFKIITRTCRF